MENLDVLYDNITKVYLIYLVLGSFIVGLYTVITRGRPWNRTETIILILIGGGFVIPVMAYITIVSKFKKYINRKN